MMFSPVCFNFYRRFLRLSYISRKSGENISSKIRSLRTFFLAERKSPAKLSMSADNLIAQTAKGRLFSLPFIF